MTVAKEVELLTPSAVGLAPRWYAIKTRARHEKKVRDRLLMGQIETFLPLCERWSQWKDRKQRVESPLFSGYCFARFPLTDRIRILNIPGIACLVGMNGHAEPVEDAEIDAIRRLIASRFRYDQHPFLEEGMEVEVVRGPLAGVRGRLLRKDRSTRLVLAVTLIRQAAVVEIHPADVARV
ncbi:MAG: UpxY family transcription antiterminator [Candidatus Rokubacteria bacterium]|nr:UpxY family transcription antiterminator [Candidatus Rokubacteria bacterium]MBI4594430.1 UpxY family transcription antiterminator [Candidatus Rokubacteria bacterium]